MLNSMPSLDLMAVAPLLIRGEEEEEVGEVTLTAIITSTLASLTVETVGALPSRTPGATAATSSSRNKEGNTGGLGRLDANFAATSDTLHSNALSLCIMGIKASANLFFSDVSAANPVIWFPNTGVNQHITPDITGMTHADPYLGNDQLYIGDGKGLIVSNTAYKILHTPKRTFTLSNILHVPKIKKRLLYVQQYCCENCVFY
jgi:hypothetical protein